MTGWDESRPDPVHPVRDHVAGQARSQHTLVHRHATYDVKVDTAALTPEASAAAILDAVGR